MSGGATAHELAVMAEQVTARGVHGVVAAAAPQAAQAGAAALRDGGNAYDAAVAAALAETVLLPPKCGFGGDLIAIVIPGFGVEPQALIAVGGAAAGHADVARAGRWRDVGPDSVGPPAAAAGYAALADRGRLERERLATPAIALALDGFAWAEVCTRLSRLAADLVAEMNPGGCVYYPGGEPIAPGTVVRLPGLADVLREWVGRGAALLEGPVGAAIAREIGARGGALTTEDFVLATADWMPCVQAAPGDRTLWATPAPTHGPGLLSAIVDYVAGGDESVAGVHRAVMAAIERQRRELGDPGGTSMVSAADAGGTVVVVVHSNSYPRFGSGIVVPEYALTLANRAGRGFTPEPGHANFPERGRRPATTLHAWAVSDNGGAPKWAGATPGGVNQLPWNAQTLARLLAGEERPGMLVAGALWEWIADDDGLRVETGFAAEDVEALRAQTSRVVSAPRWGCKSAQQVVRVPLPGEAWEAAADPRTVGLALGI
ncbi:MAG TPA: gamma-glutamyltransferase [Ilumatobacter sp.]|nr:gamma-glutamyltransferase [Ilumatobacter sp.]